jgi:hypothetical protein
MGAVLACKHMGVTMPKQIAVVIMLAFAVVLFGAVPHANAQQSTTISITVRNHRFQPAQLHAPANVPITLRVKNLDSTSMEFESVSLRVEKVVAANGEAVIQLRALGPGRYDFFDDFNDKVNGVLVVR